MDTAAAVNALLRAGKAQATRNILATAAETRVAAVSIIVSLVKNKISEQAGAMVCHPRHRLTRENRKNPALAKTLTQISQPNCRIRKQNFGASRLIEVNQDAISSPPLLKLERPPKAYVYCECLYIVG